MPLEPPPTPASRGPSAAARAQATTPTPGPPVAKATSPTSQGASSPPAALGRPPAPSQITPPSALLAPAGPNPEPPSPLLATQPPSVTDGRTAPSPIKGAGEAAEAAAVHLGPAEVARSQGKAPEVGKAAKASGALGHRGEHLPGPPVSPSAPLKDVPAPEPPTRPTPTAQPQLGH